MFLILFWFWKQNSLFTILREKKLFFKWKRFRKFASKKTKFVWKRNVSLILFSLVSLFSFFPFLSFSFSIVAMTVAPKFSHICYHPVSTYSKFFQTSVSPTSLQTSRFHLCTRSTRFCLMFSQRFRLHGCSVFLQFKWYFQEISHRDN